MGKSITATAFCRIFKNRGISVAPFKAQNLSNNSFVTLEGGEIGRAQQAQAEAAGCRPTVHMNPVLLKPGGQAGAQMVVLGKAVAPEDNRNRRSCAKSCWTVFHLLSQDHDAIVIEGAGSCAEVNLRENDIVNF